MKKFIVGSCAFFRGIAGFNPKDTDYVVLVEKEDANFVWKRHICKQGEDIFKLVRYDKEKMIDFTKRSVASGVCMFLVPQFVEELGVTIDDLSKLKSNIDRLDNKHKYLRVIYEAYLANNSFTLTEEQRLRAYDEYKKERPKIV